MADRKKAENLRPRGLRVLHGVDATAWRYEERGRMLVVVQPRGGVAVQISIPRHVIRDFMRREASRG